MDHSVSVAALRKGLTVFFDKNSLRYSNEEDKKILESLPEDKSIPAYALGDRYIQNTFYFKTPINICITSSSSEREFVKKLVKKRVQI
ncbi:MAG: hypothetical protein QXL14_03800 [Candidatus Aenigmatarchaeota archaeon]